jgi:thiamine pyrophosphate-dependent acetolactate synthase large subunit-like protein
MAIFNAYCDRVPILLIGATGPVDAELRRPWIDWIHTTADQAALIRGYTKWDDQPASVGAAVESILRANVVATTYPAGPTYVCLDAALQEAELDRPAKPLLSPGRRRAPQAPLPRSDELARVCEIVRASPRTALLFGRVGRSEAAWEARIALAEQLGAQVLTDPKLPVAFPLPHDRHAAEPAALLSASATEMLRDATAIVSFDWVDLGGTLRTALGSEPVEVPVVHASLDHVLHNGWSKDHFSMTMADLSIAAHPDGLVDGLVAAGVERPERWSLPAATRQVRVGDGIQVGDLAAALREALAGVPHSLVRVPIGWDATAIPVTHPLDALGADGGAGIGSGPGMAVGAALGLADSDRLAVAVLGDGDFLMGASALWTAARYHLALLVVVSNNESFYNDEMHQERVARRRGRPVGNRWIGQRIGDPRPDLATHASSLGLVGLGPIDSEEELASALERAVAGALEGAAVLVDVHTDPNAYPIETGTRGTARGRV